MKIKLATIIDHDHIEIAKISFHKKRNTLKGLYDNNNDSAALLKKKRAYDFKREFNKYIDQNYGDVLSKNDKKRLMGLVDEHYEEGCIENVKDLHRHIRKIGHKHNLIFD